MDSLIAISEWLAQTSLSITIVSTPWAVPMLQSVHIIAIGIVFASVAMLNLRLAGFIGKEQSLSGMTKHFYPWIWGALVVLVITGLFQIMAEPGRELLNWVFWTKMGLLVAAILVTAPVRSMLEDCRFRDLSPEKRKTIRNFALLSLLFWVAIIVCGRWIAYAGALVDQR